MAGASSLCKSASVGLKNVVSFNHTEYSVSRLTQVGTVQTLGLAMASLIYLYTHAYMMCTHTYASILHVYVHYNYCLLSAPAFYLLGGRAA